MSKKYKVVLVSGGFDPVHKGHLEMIEKASEIGEEVWVILNNDSWLREKKGQSFMNENEREKRAISPRQVTLFQGNRIKFSFQNSVPIPL